MPTASPAPKQQTKPKITLKKILKPEFLTVFEQAHGSVAAAVGTAAHDYMSRKLRIAEVEQDSRYLGAVPQPDGALLLFDDGSTALALHAGFTPTESQAITDGMLGKDQGGSVNARNRKPSPRPATRNVAGRKGGPATLDRKRYTAHRMAHLVSDGAGGLFTDPAYPSPRMPDGSVISIPPTMFGSFALYDEQKKAFVVRDALPAISYAGRAQGIIRAQWEYHFVGTRAEVLQYIRKTTVRKFNLERVNDALDGQDVA